MRVNCLLNTSAQDAEGFLYEITQTSSEEDDCSDDEDLPFTGCNIEGLDKWAAAFWSKSLASETQGLVQSLPLKAQEVSSSQY